MDDEVLAQLQSMDYFYEKMCIVTGDASGEQHAPTCGRSPFIPLKTHHFTSQGITDSMILYRGQ